jgi:hypothetical protein
MAVPDFEDVPDLTGTWVLVRSVDDLPIVWANMMTRTESFQPIQMNFSSW